MPSTNSYPVVVTEVDFDRLTDMSARWSPTLDDQMMDGRFDSIDRSADGYTPVIGHPAYWMGDNYAVVVLAKTFLQGEGHPFIVLWDEVPNPDCQYAIVTPYETPVWRGVR